jgi:hypothetical protein
MSPCQRSAVHSAEARDVGKTARLRFDRDSELDPALSQAIAFRDVKSRKNAVGTRCPARHGACSNSP